MINKTTYIISRMPKFHSILCLTLQHPLVYFKYLYINNNDYLKKEVCFA